MGMAVAADPALVDAFVADDLVASLLLVHGLHPHDVDRRIEDALDSVRPYLGSHGGDVNLLGVDGDVVRLRVRRQLQELSVVVGHPGAGGRGCGARGGAGDRRRSRWLPPKPHRVPR